MKKLRSLLFREFKVCKKLYIMRSLFLLAFFAFIIVAAFSCSAIVEDMPDKERLMRTFAERVSMLIILCSAVVFAEEHTFKSDLNSGWNGYSYILPITAAERAAVKLIHFIITVGASQLLGFICITVVNAVMGESLHAQCLILMLICVDVLLLAKTIVGHFLLRARNMDEYKKLQEKGSMIYLVIMICAALAFLRCAGVDFAALLNSETDLFTDLDIYSRLHGTMLIWLIPLTLALFAAHFAVICHHSKFAYSGGIKTEKAKVKKEKPIDITAPHSEPVGFLYKELRQNIKSISAVVLLPFIILVFTVGCIALVSLDEKYGGDGWIVRTLTSNVIRIAALALGYLYAGGLLLSVFHGDDRKLWAYFTVSAPMGLQKFLSTKYKLSFAMCGLYFVSSYVADTIVASISWFALREEIVSFTSILVIVFFALILYNSFSIPMMLRFGEKKGSIINITVVLCAITVGLLVFAFMPTHMRDKLIAWFSHIIQGSYGDITILLLGSFPVISVVAYILSYKASCKIFMKGVEEYDK